MPIPVPRILRSVPAAWVSQAADDRKRSRRAARNAIVTAALGFILVLTGAGIYVGITAKATEQERAVYLLDREIAHETLHARADLEDFLATGRKELLERHGVAMKNLASSLSAMKEKSRLGGPSASATGNAVDALSAAIGDWRARYVRVAIRLRLSGKERESNILRGMQQRGVSATHSRMIERRLDALQGMSDAWLEDLRTSTAGRRASALWVLLAGFLVAFGGVAYFVRWHLVQRSILLRRSARLEDLAEYADRMHHLDNADEAARSLASSIAPGGRRSTVLFRIPGESGMRIAAYTGEVPPSAGNSPVLADKEACPVMRTGQRFVIRDPKVEPPCNCPVCASRDGGYACVPLLAQGKTAGLVNWQAAEGRSPSPASLNRVEEFARVTSLALTNLFSLEGAKHDALTDQLTGVANRRFLDGYLAKQLQISLRQERTIGVLMLDLDLFKRFNDQNGHLAGDSVLKAAAKAAVAAVREEDLVARYGGEEFSVILPDADIAKALEIAERIRKGIAGMRVEELPGLLPPVITVSVGAAVAPAHGNTVQAILRAADLALYSAKEKGRNQVVAAPG
jgi:diguanylate cyclase (GGDEF)-like protein